MEKISSRSTVERKKSDSLFQIHSTFMSFTDEPSDFKFGMQLHFAKAHHEIPLEEKVGVALG